MTRKKLISREVALIVSMIGIVLLMVLQFIWLRNAYRISEQNLKDKCMECLEEALSIEFFERNIIDDQSPYTNLRQNINNLSQFDIVIQDSHLIIKSLINLTKVDSLFSQLFIEKYNVTPNFELYLSRRKEYTHSVYECLDSNNELITRDEFFISSILDSIYVQKKVREKTKNSIILSKQLNSCQNINLEIINPVFLVLRNAKYVLIISIIIVFFIALILLFLLRSALRENRFVRFIKEYTNALTHDLRSPLNSIYMASSSVYKNGESMSINTVRDYIRMCKEQSKDLLDQIDRILTVAKTEQTELIVDKKTIFLKPFLQEVTGKFVDDKVHAKPISLEVECDENVEVPMDQRLMTRVMNNLLDNAVKYSYETALINVKAWKEGNTVRIRVKDNGMGIPAKDLDAIFEHFNQGSVLERKGQFGYGIGLSFIKQVIQSHGGHMEVVNKEEEGSEFIIVLPA